MNRYYLTFLAFLITGSTFAQQTKQLTDNDYQHAERFLGYNTSSLVDNGNVSPTWLPNGRFWYRNLNAGGSEFILVDPQKKKRTPVFDKQRLADALSSAAGKTYKPDMLPFRSFEYTDENKAIIFSANGKQWKADLSTYRVTADSSKMSMPKTPFSRRGGSEAVLSPNGKLSAYIKNYNLWVRDIETKAETQLTFDGVKDFGYATDNAGWKHSNDAILKWSPDSKKIATFQQDERGTSDMYLVSTNIGKPTLSQWKYPLPGDKTIITIQRVIINVDGPKVIRLQVDADPHRASLSDDVSSSGTFDDADWSPDGSQLAFVSTSRDHKQEKVRIADANTGAVREVFEETVPTQYESGWDAINWRYLPKTSEFIWFSERDNYGHLYLYDSKAGKPKNQITKGAFVVTRLLKVDEKTRKVYFIADGLDSENPYFSKLCEVDFDGRNFKVLTPEPGNHSVTLAPSGLYFMDSYSKPDVPPTSVLRNMDGKLIVELEKTDISRLTASGWKPVTPFSIKAHNGNTNLYGLMFTPTNLDPAKKYPIIDYIYPGPQGGSVGSWSFAASRGDNQALAELGFVVIVLEGSSNPLRSKSFHDMSYGNMAENTLPDQVTGIRQLAQRYAYIDTTKVGIWGHSGGGFATATAMFKYPDFFKVGISESGNHDNRNYEDDWGERYDGLVTTSDYDKQANQNYAKNLKGKLLLAHGLMDDNVPPQNTLLVVEALEKANKDYDLIVFPNSAHGYGSYSLYMMRRRWDYFVKNLLGSEPPKEFLMKPAIDPRNKTE